MNILKIFTSTLLVVSSSSLLLAQSDTTKPLFEMESIISEEQTLEEELMGMTLKFTEESKQINIELPDGEFFELNFKIPYYIPSDHAFVQLGDIRTIDTLVLKLKTIKNLPLQEYIQPETQREFSNIINSLDDFSLSLGKRLWIFSLTDEEIEELRSKFIND